jgi:23S rRNA (uracil1939-C5)-methyltransferase
MEKGEYTQGTVEKVIFGGYGLIRKGLWVILVSDVAPGEEVEVQIVENKKSYSIARLVRLIRPSPFRVQPRCPYFGTCGGCQLQHLQYEEQLRLKASWLKEALERIGKLHISQDIVCKPALAKWAYRQRVVLHVQDGKIGFFARDNKTVVDIKSCPIFAKKSFERCDRSQKRLVVCSNASRTIDIEGLRIAYSDHVFVQNSPHSFLQIYKDVLEIAGDPLDGNGKLLDLYSGIGIFSLLAARKGWQVFSVEASKKAVQLHKENMRVNAIDTIRVVSALVEDVERLVDDLQSYQIWLVNPPRTGLSQQVIQTIISQAPKQLIYISCMPSTLARDVKKLSEAGYELHVIKAYDMFPQTTHLEAVVSLQRNTNLPNMMSVFPL